MKLRATPTMWVLSLCLGGSFFVPRSPAEVVLLTGETMGTSYRIKVAVAGGNDKALLQKSVDERLREIDQRMSTYRTDSDVSRFNRADANTWVAVHPETARVVELAIRISRETEGAFDSTVGPIVNLWNFGPNRRDTFRPPSPDRIQEALARVGSEKIEVRWTDPSAALRKVAEGVAVDLSGIAKGYAVDAMSELLREHGVDSSMVEIGGEIRVQGTNQGKSWRIGIESPARTGRQMEAIVQLHDVAMASSGDYRNYFEYKGQIYSHTIDPRTGQPVDSELAGVTVIAESCARADALATGLMAMGPKAFEWAADHHIQALFLTRENDSFVRSVTPFFPKLVDQRRRQPASFPMLALAALVVFGLAILSMSLGTLIANKRLRGSCGGMAGLQDEHGRTLCDMCTNPSPQCAGPNEDH